MISHLWIKFFSNICWMKSYLDAKPTLFLGCVTFYNLTYLLLAVLGLGCREGFSVVVEREGCSLAVVCSLTAVVSLVAEHRL